MVKDQLMDLSRIDQTVLMATKLAQLGKFLMAKLWQNFAAWVDKLTRIVRTYVGIYSLVKSLYKLASI